MQTNRSLRFCRRSMLEFQAIGMLINCVTKKKTSKEIQKPKIVEKENSEIVIIITFSDNQLLYESRSILDILS